MKLYHTPLACSLADHIALLEVHFERERVDLKTSARPQAVTSPRSRPRTMCPCDIRDALEAILAFEQQQEDQLVNYIAGKGYR